MNTKRELEIKSLIKVGIADCIEKRRTAGVCDVIRDLCRSDYISLKEQTYLQDGIKRVFEEQRQKYGRLAFYKNRESWKAYGESDYDTFFNLRYEFLELLIPK